MQKTLIAALAATCLLFACEREETVAPDAAAPEALMTTPPQAVQDGFFRGIYFDGMYDPSNGVDYLGNVAWEEQMLDWVVNSGFNSVTFYGITQALNDGRGSDVEKLVERSHLRNLHVAFNTAGLTGLATQINYYNAGGVVPMERPDALSSEYEFWNPNFHGSGNPGVFATYQSLMSQMSAFAATTTSPPVSRHAYIHKWEDASDPSRPENAICNQVLVDLDRLLLVNYHSNAHLIHSQLMPRIQVLADEAYALGQPVEVEILFNVNYHSISQDIFNYFSQGGQNHAWRDAYDSFVQDFANSSINNKDYIHFRGFQIYRLTEAMEARPNP